MSVFFQKSLNICLITNAYPPMLNGVAQAVYSLEQKLAALGHKVYIVTLAVPKTAYEPNVMAFHSFQFPRMMSQDLRWSPTLIQPGIYARRIAQFCRKHKIDIIHNHDTYGLSNIPGKVGKMLKIPVVHTFHTDIESYRKILNVPGFRHILRAIIAKSCNVARITISPSEKMAQYLREKVRVKNPVVVLKNEINPQLVQYLKKNYQHSKRTQVKTFITFGRVAAEKGIETTLAAIAPVLRSDSTLRYIIAGIAVPSYLDQLKNRITDLQIASQVLFTGAYRSIEELGLLASQADVFLFTSHSETFGITLVEAMGFGLPVIALKDECFREILSEKTAFICETTDDFSQRCTTVANQTFADLISFRTAALQSFEIMQHHNVAREHADIYQTLLQK